MLLRAGADKTSVNTAAVERPELVAEIAAEFGSQCVVVAIDARRTPGVPTMPSGFEVFTHGGRTPTGIDALWWAKTFLNALDYSAVFLMAYQDHLSIENQMALIKATPKPMRIRNA